MEEEDQEHHEKLECHIPGAKLETAPYANIPALSNKNISYFLTILGRASRVSNKDEGHPRLRLVGRPQYSAHWMEVSMQGRPVRRALCDA